MNAKEIREEKELGQTGFLREIAAQLAELNENLIKFNEPTNQVTIEEGCKSIVDGYYDRLSGKETDICHRPMPCPIHTTFLKHD